MGDIGQVAEWCVARQVERPCKMISKLLCWRDSACLLVSACKSACNMVTMSVVAEKRIEHSNSSRSSTYAYSTCSRMAGSPKEARAVCHMHTCWLPLALPDSPLPVHAWTNLTCYLCYHRALTAIGTCHGNHQHSKSSSEGGLVERRKAAQHYTAHQVGAGDVQRALLHAVSMPRHSVRSTGCTDVWYGSQQGGLGGVLG